MLRILSFVALGLALLTSPALATPPERAPAGPEPRMAYAAFGKLYGEPEHIKLAPDGSHFLALYFPKEGGSILRLWRIEGEQAFQVRSWEFADKAMLSDFQNQTAVAPGGAYVALSAYGEGDARQQQSLQFLRVAENGGGFFSRGRESFDLPAIDHQEQRNVSCGLAFLDANHLVACRKGVKSAGGQAVTLALISGFSQNDIALRSRLDIPKLGSMTTSTMVRPNGDTLLVNGVHVFGVSGEIALVRVQGDKLEWITNIGNAGKSSMKPILMGDKGEGYLYASSDNELTHILSSTVVKQRYRNSNRYHLLVASSADGRLLLGKEGKVYLVRAEGLFQVADTSDISDIKADSVFFGPRRILTVSPISLRFKDIAPSVIEAATLHSEGLEMLGVGFAGPGFAKLRQSVERDLDHWSYSPEGFEQIAKDVSVGKIKGGLTEAGKFFQHLARVAGPQINGARLDVPTQKGELTLGDLVGQGRSEHPLHGAGASKGDLLIAVNGRAIPSRIELDTLMKSLTPGGTASVSVKKSDGRIITAQVSLRPMWRSLYLHTHAIVIHGLLAAQAGHPGITRQAEATIRKMVDEGDLNRRYIAAANLLGGLVRALNEGGDAGHDYILVNGGLIMKDLYEVGQLYAEKFATAAAPLYSNREKMAFLMKMPADKLPRPSLARHPPQPFPDLAGRIIEPSGVVQAPAAAPPPSSALPAPTGAVGGGRVLE